MNKPKGKKPDLEGKSFDLALWQGQERAEIAGERLFYIIQYPNGSYNSCGASWLDIIGAGAKVVAVYVSRQGKWEPRNEFINSRAGEAVAISVDGIKAMGRILAIKGEWALVEYQLPGMEYHIRFLSTVFKQVGMEFNPTFQFVDYHRLTRDWLELVKLAGLNFSHPRYDVNELLNRREKNNRGESTFEEWCNL